jgi:hypothetical protein
MQMISEASDRVDVRRGEGVSDGGTYLGT